MSSLFSTDGGEPLIDTHAGPLGPIRLWVNQRMRSTRTSSSATLPPQPYPPRRSSNLPVLKFPLYFCFKILFSAERFCGYAEYDESWLREIMSRHQSKKFQPGEAALARMSRYSVARDDGSSVLHPSLFYQNGSRKKASLLIHSTTQSLPPFLFRNSAGGKSNGPHSGGTSVGD